MLAREMLRLVPARRTSLVALCLLVILPLLVGWFRRGPAASRVRIYPEPADEIPTENLIGPLDKAIDDRSYRPADVALPSNPAVTSIPQNSFFHTDFFHAPKHAGDVDYCAVVTAEQIQQLADLVEKPIDLLQPLAWQFQDGALVSPSHNGFPVGTGFCTIILNPQTPWRRRLTFQQLPIHGTGPDHLQIQVASDDVRLVMTEHPGFRGNVHVKDALQDSVEFAVYASSYVLLQPGTYHLSGASEWHYYDWAMEEPIDLSKMFHRYRPDNTSLINSLSPPISVTGVPVSRPRQHCYRGSNDDLRGRWYRSNAFKQGGSQSVLNNEAHLEYADQDATTDDWGWTFAPDRCRLTYFSPADHRACLANKNIQIIGDSNSRRVLKSVMGGGLSWCNPRRPRERIANCEDREEEELKDFTGAEVDIELVHDNALDKLRPVTFGEGTRLFIDFVGGIIRSTILNGWQLYLNDNKNPNDVSVTKQRQQSLGPTDVVYLSLITWDVSHVLTAAETLARLPEFREKLLSSYDERARFVIRLANSPSYDNYNNRSRFSVPRLQMWNTMWREFWEEDRLSGRVKFEDASILQGREDAERATKCPQTHLRCSHVRIEAQIWMNMICEKQPDGAARMLDW